MKKIILSLALSLCALAGFSQTDPTVTNPSIAPSPIPGNNPYATLSFDFANLGPDPISNLDPDGISDPIVLTITMSNGTWDDVHNAVPVDAIGGSYSTYFTWTYDAGTFTGVQNQPVLGFDGGSITIAYKATAESVSAAPGNGFTVNLTSNGNAPNGPGTNDINNDTAVSKTFVDGPLPVTLVSFTAAKEGNTAQLNWATTEETNSDYFEIQHSLTGKAWAPVGKLSSHGESSSLKNYTFSHSTPVNGENLYRLKMVDKDQTYAYSRIRSVKFDGLVDADLSVYPNPVTDKLSIRDISGVAQINIYDLKGVNLYQSVNPATAEINVKDLRAGMYIVKIQRANGLSSSQKIVVNK